MQKPDLPVLTFVVRTPGYLNLIYLRVRTGSPATNAKTDSVIPALPNELGILRDASRPLQRVVQFASSRSHSANRDEPSSKTSTDYTPPS